MGVSGIVDSIMRKLCLTGEQNVAKYAGVCTKPMPELQPQTHVLRFKMLNSLDVVQAHSFAV
jgi:hypothetical protein